jgi:2-dehydro-3-deoxyphosphogluconate aldolase/(4S)-4-hydroxy-2-oxoglutarate aldolase
VTLLDISPVAPVVVLEDTASAVPLARALVAGGVGIVEITLRSAASFDAIRAISRDVPQIRVGAGVVCTPGQVTAAVDAGAGFLTSPGVSDRLLDAMDASGLPYLASCASPSDMLRVLERGVTEAKLFPASVVGGVALLKAVYGVLPQLRFCPTGGISAATATEYLTLPNVGCVGGTWLTPGPLLAARDWGAITELSAAATRLRPRAATVVG